MRPLGIVFGAAIIAGCSLLAPPQPEPVKAVLSQLPDIIPHAHFRAVSLVVVPPTASPAYATTRMAYSERRYQIGYFRDHEWAEPPAQMIDKLLIQTLEQTGSFRSVLSPPDIGPGEYTLRTELLELIQDYSRAGPVLRLVLRAELLGSSSRSVASTDIAVQEPIRERKPYAGVVAANAAVAKALQRVAEFVLGHAR